MSNIVPFNELSQMALSVTKSGMFGLKNENQALTLMMIAQAEGIHPIQAIQQYSIINGMPSLKSTEVQARFQKGGGKINWIETSDKQAVCELSIDGQTYKSEFNFAQATQMGLVSKDNWKRMPKQMLMARAVSSGVRALYPQCLNNMYSVEEAEQIVDTNATNTMPTIEATDVEVIPEPTTNSLKLMLSNRLKELSFSSADIKEFAESYKLNENEELLENLVNDKELLMSKVTEFENGEQK